MTFSQFVKAALELGVIPAIAIFLIFGLFLQNRRLLAQHQRLLEIFAEVVLRAQVLQGQDTSQLPFPGSQGHPPPSLPPSAPRGLPPAPEPAGQPAAKAPPEIPREVVADHRGIGPEPPTPAGREGLEGPPAAAPEAPAEEPKGPPPPSPGERLQEPPEERPRELTVLRPKGKITIGAGDIMLRGMIEEALDAGSRNIVLDLAQVTTMDSSGIGELVSGYTTVSNRGGTLVLSRPPAKVRDILTVTQLISVFEVYDSEEGAKAAFA